MFTKAFWKDAGERAVQTAAQALLSLWVVGDVLFNAFEIDVTASLGVAAGAAVISALKSLVVGRVTDGTASPVKEVEYWNRG